MCAVKADAYGHGAIECTKVMRASGADQFAVATVAEGVELRKAGIEWPILMLNQAPESAIDTLVEYDIMPSVFKDGGSFVSGTIMHPFRPSPIPGRIASKRMRQNERRAHYSYSSPIIIERSSMASTARPIFSITSPAITPREPYCSVASRAACP